MAKDSPFKRGKYRSVKRNGRWVTIDKNGKVVKVGQRVVEGLKRGKARVKNTVKSMKISNLKKRLKTEGSKYIYADKPGPGGKQETVYQQKKRTGGSGKSRTWKNPVGAKGGGQPSSGKPDTWTKQNPKNNNQPKTENNNQNNTTSQQTKKNTTSNNTKVQPRTWSKPYGALGGGKPSTGDLRTDKQKWIDKTRGKTPAARAWGNSEAANAQRWALQQKKRQFDALRKSGGLKASNFKNFSRGLRKFKRGG